MKNMLNPKIRYLSSLCVTQIQGFVRFLEKKIGHQRNQNTRDWSSKTIITEKPEVVHEGHAPPCL